MDRSSHAVEIVGRLDELIAQGAAIPLTDHSRVRSSNYITGEVRREHFSLVSYQDFIEWRTSCLAVLDLAVPTTSLLRVTVMKFGTLKNDPASRDFAVAFLRSVRKEIERGSLVPLARKIEQAVVADLLEQAANEVKDKNTKYRSLSSVVIAGASLERHLRAMCDTLDPPEAKVNAKGERLMLNGLIDALKKREAFNELQAKELRAWAALRNHAAHGELDAFTQAQAESMVTGVQRFLAESP